MTFWRSCAIMLGRGRNSGFRLGILMATFQKWRTHTVKTGGQDVNGLIKPFTPEEAARYKRGNKVKLPNFVIEAINEALGEACAFASQGAIITRSGLITRIRQKGGITNDERELSYYAGYLDFKDEYEKYGWTITSKQIVSSTGVKDVKYIFERSAFNN